MSTDPTPDWAVLPGPRFALGEGSRWVDGRVVMVDILTGRLLRLPADLAGPPTVELELGEPLGAVAPLTGGGWIAAAGTGAAVLLPERPPYWLARPDEGAQRPMRVNDAAADPFGRFWFGSMAYDQTEGAGSLYRVDWDGRVTPVLSGLTVPNGPAFGADGSLLYLADSARGVVYRFPVEPSSGALGERAVFATVSGGNPDGMTVDLDGHLWVAIWGAGEIHRYRPDGHLDQVLPVPARQPTSVCLVGGRIVVTSASIGLDSPGPDDGAVLHAVVPTGGRPAAPATLARAVLDAARAAS